jgi:putative oxidoreductase
MASFMKRFNTQAYALLRVVAGLLFLCHGMQKLFSFPKAAPESPAFIIYVAGPIEIVGGALIMIGLATRWAAFICAGQMAVAYWLAHGTQALFPLVNGGELAALYCFVFLFISAHGPGIWSIDEARGRSTKVRPAAS